MVMDAITVNPVTCPACHGSGGGSFEKDDMGAPKVGWCPTCDGTGYVIRKPDSLSQVKIRTMTATHIEVEAEVRYWEDAAVNGVVDADGSLIPGRAGDLWKVRIDLAAGRIEAWPEGTEARIHYRSATLANTG